jgi:hypothetical protein
MALREWRLHYLSMETHARMPRVGDRVRIKGFLGVFEVVEVGPQGSMVDVKHLDLPGPAYIEKEVLWHELVYLHAQQKTTLASLPALWPVDGSRLASALGVPHRST